MDHPGKVADCILAVEQEIDYSSIDSSNLYVVVGNRVTRMSPSYLFRVAKVSNAKEMGMPENELRKRIQFERGEAKGLAERSLGEIAELLAGSRIRFSMLLDTSGGVGLYLENLEAIKSYVVRSGGDFAAYGGVDVKSLGAKLLMMAPKRLRFAHPLSNIMFHLPTPDPRAKVSKCDQRRNRKENQREIRDLLLDEASEDQHDEVQGKLDESLLAEVPKTPDRRVEFSGKMAGKWGMLETMNADTMARHLLDRHKMPSGVLRLGLIRQFFAELVAHERQARDQSRLLLAIFGKDKDE